MKINCEVKVKYKLKRINSIIQQFPQIASEITEDILKNIRGYAVKLEKGHNEEGIIFEIVDMTSKKVKGRVFADPSHFMSNDVCYLFFEYFGTGQYAEMAHVGNTKHFIESGYTEWFIPVEKVEKVLSYPTVDIQGTKFYIAHGAKANHFMGDAEFESRNENIDIAKQTLNKMLKEICKK